MIKARADLKRGNSTYDLAIKFENEGFFKVAFPLFLECLKNEQIDKGDLYFHCGWCAEQSENGVSHTAVRYYIKAGQNAKNSTSRMNSYFRAGWILMLMQEFQKAINAFKYAIETGHHESEIGKLYAESIYWCAFCLENDGRILDAIELYRTVTSLSTELNPESRFRELICLISVGFYEKAILACKSFDNPAPPDFDLRRYEELKFLAKKEEGMLLTCFNSSMFNEKVKQP